MPSCLFVRLVFDTAKVCFCLIKFVYNTQITLTLHELFTQAPCEGKNGIEILVALWYSEKTTRKEPL